MPSASWLNGWLTGDIVTAAEYKKGVGSFFDTVLTGTAATIDITVIPATYAHLLLEVSARGDNAAANVSLQMRFNGDTGANYYDETLTAAATTVVGLEDLAQGLNTIALVPAATATANCFGVARIQIFDYANTARFKAWESTTAARWSTATAGHNTGVHGGDWASTAAINRITLSVAGGNFVAGTRVTAYAMGF